MDTGNTTGNHLVPVTIVGGFLGAGKTTFLKRLLSTPQGRKLAVVVNDFGDLNIDVKLISEVREDIVEVKASQLRAEDNRSPFALCSVLFALTPSLFAPCSLLRALRG